MELDQLKRKLERFREQNPKRKFKYPDELWDEIVKFSDQFTPSQLGKKLGISGPNLARQIKARKSDESKASSSFVQVPVPTQNLSKKQMTLELPHGITLRIDL